MYKHLALLIMLSATCVLQAEPEKKEFSREQLDKLKASEEKYKDNPAIMNIIGKIKNQAGLTEEKEIPETSTPAPLEPKIQGSASVADKAYAKKDYATAFAHYKALAETGDADASLILGIMYEQGQGIEKDPITAYAWYRKSADADKGHNREMRSQFEKFENRELTKDEIMEVDKRYEAINKELTGVQPVDPAVDIDDQKIIFTINRELLATGPVRNFSTASMPASGVVFIPQKQYPMQHYQPEKFQRATP